MAKKTLKGIAGDLMLVQNIEKHEYRHVRAIKARLRQLTSTLRCGDCDKFKPGDTCEKTLVVQSKTSFACENFQ